MMKSAFEYICKRERYYGGGHWAGGGWVTAKGLVDHHFTESNGILFRKNLMAHYGCVNALEFSQDGSLLASGGDDRRVLVWNVHQAIVGNETPIVLEAEHRSNVFALAFDSSQRKIVSAGNDDNVIVHDIHTGKPMDYFLQEQPVFGVSTDPLNDNIFTVAGDDGRLLIYDMRDSSEPFCLAKYHSAFHSVMFHPVEPRLILSANAKEGASLWDVRMAKKVLLKYGRQMGDQCCMNARFNQNGSQVLSLRRRLPPVLYSTHSSSHLFQFNHSSYYNSCTMKSCSFGGTSDQFVMSGSDNFDLHVWKIPSDGSNRWVNEASLVLRGHRSIVNQVRYNYSHNLIASSGVEKMIKIWSPFSIPDESCWTDDEPGRTSESPRQIYSHEEYVRLYMRTSHGHFFSMSQNQDLSRNTNEDSRMLAFFDALVQRDIAGLSDDESDADSTYTNTVYSTGSSTSDNENDEPSSVGGVGFSHRGLTSPIYLQGGARTTATEANHRIPSSDDNLEDDEPRLLDIEDLPIIDSSTESDQETQRSPSTNEDNSNLVPIRPDSSVGTSEPNTLTKLIATRELQLRKLASNKQPSKFKRKDDEQHVSNQSSITAGTGSDSSTSSSSSSGSPLPLRGRRRSIQTTPVYESSNNSPGPSYQLINNLMTRNFTSPSSSTQRRAISVYTSSSSSSSSSTSASDDDQESESNSTLCNLFFKTSSPSSQQFSADEHEGRKLSSSGCLENKPNAQVPSHFKNKKASSRKIRISKHLTNSKSSNNVTTVNSSDCSTFSLRKRKRRKKPTGLSVKCFSKKLKSDTPPDSGIDISNADADADLQPVAGCSHSSLGQKRSRPPFSATKNSTENLQDLDTDSDSND